MADDEKFFPDAPRLDEIQWSSTMPTTDPLRPPSTRDPDYPTKCLQHDMLIQDLANENAFLIEACQRATDAANIFREMHQISLATCHRLTLAILK